MTNNAVLTNDKVLSTWNLGNAERYNSRDQVEAISQGMFYGMNDQNLNVRSSQSQRTKVKMLACAAFGAVSKQEPPFKSWVMLKNIGCVPAKS